MTDRYQIFFFFYNVALGPPQTYATATAARHATANRQEVCGIYPVSELKATPHSVIRL